VERAFGWARLPATGETVATAEIRVYEAGTLTPATIYDDDLSPVPTLKANPFFADVDGYWFFYAPNGRYDVVVADGTPAIPVAYTIGDVNLGLGDCGPAANATASLPLPGLPHVGRLRYVTDAAGGVYIDTGTEWVPLTGFGIPAIPIADLPTPGVPGRLRIVTDDVRGIWQDQGTFWFNIFGEVVNVQDFGAVGDGSADDTGPIQAAIDALAATGGGGAVLIPARTFGISAPLVLRNGTVLRGTSQRGSVIKALSSFAGDSLVRGFSRDNNTTDYFEAVGIYNLSLQAPASSPTSLAAIDATGWHRSIVSAVTLLGGGTAVANQTAIRISDRNPLGTSNKDCLANRFESISALNWNRFLYCEESVLSASGGTVDGNSIEQWFSVSRVGIVFGTTQFGSVLALSSGLLAGDGVAGAGNVALNAVPPFIELNQVTVLAGAPFGDGLGALADLRRALFVNAPFGLGRAGTSQAFPTFVGGVTPGYFVSGAYVGIAAGTPLVAGINLFTYTLTLASVFIPAGASTLVFPSLNPPSVLQTLYATLAGDTLTLTVVAGAAQVLPSAFVMRLLVVV
jgi:hypothetical protein